MLPSAVASAAPPPELRHATWTDLIRDIPDFPKAGILFKDITPVLADAQGFADAINTMATPWRDVALDAVVGVEARGFILGAALARELGVGFVPVRKPGKLPAHTLSLDYGLEYGRDRLEIHVDAIPAGARVLVVDDVLATGGTLKAAVRLAEQQGARVVGTAVLVELGFLQARTTWDHAAPLLASAVY